MEFLRIGETKLKVTLSKEEAKEYNIKLRDGAYAGNELRACLRRVLEEAKRRSGFDAGGDKLLVQLYPADGGGCELFATKLQALAEREKRMVTASENLTTYSGGRAVYCFPDLSTLIAATRVVASRCNDCDVYAADSGEYYISAREHTLNGISDLDILSEYGKRMTAIPRHILKEHTKLLVEGRGIEIFSKL